MAKEGFMGNQHLKSITKSKLQPHIALQQDIYWKVNFIRKYSHAHYL